MGNYGDNWRKAVRSMGVTKRDHERQRGRLPNSREIETWAKEIGRRNDRRNSEAGTRLPRDEGRPDLRDD